MRSVKKIKRPAVVLLNHIRLSLCAFLVFSTLASVFAQQKVSALEAYAEKVYVQTDREVYRKGEKIWFKSIVAQAKDNLPSTLSGVLHVELVDPFETVIAQKLIKLNEGIGSNFFKIEDFFVIGTYKLRAYTRWDKNFDNNFLFSKYISIADENQPQSIISKIEGKDNKVPRFLFNPQLIDSTSGSKIELELAYDDQLKKRIIRKNAANYFLLEEDIPKDTKWVHFKLITESGKQWSESLLLSKEAIDIQFLPEGGKFIAGFNNLLGFKAIDETGKGVSVSGTIYDAQDKLVTTFKSNELGMGKVNIFPNVGNSYKVKLDASEAEIDFSYSFPQVISNGSTLSVRPVGDNIVVGVNSNLFLNDSITVEVISRGISLGEIGRKLEEGKHTLYFSKESLPPGILAFKLKDFNKKPIAERLLFNDLDQARFDFDLELSQSTYKTGEEVSLELSTKTTEKDTSWFASASIVALPKELTTQETIWTSLMLTSEIKGVVEKPSFYFTETGKVKYVELDNLLLTQGWRAYKFQSPPAGEQLTVLPEMTLEVEGEVAALFNQDRPKEGIDVSLMILGENQGFYNQQTDSLGRFKFILPPFEGRRIRAVLQTKNESGKNRNYSLNLREVETPEISYDRSQAYFKTQDSLPNVFRASIKDRTPDSFFDSDPSITELDEVLISDYELTPQRQKVFDTYGKPDVVIDGKEIELKEDKYSNGLYGVLRQSFGDKISFQQYQDSTGLSYQKAVITGGLETIVLVDGIIVLADAYQYLPTLPPSEIKSVEILENVSKNFIPLYRRQYPFEDLLETPLMGSILAIYTYSGKGLYTTYESKGILKTNIEPFAPTKEFYIPKYDSGETALGPGDNAVTLYWNPNLSLQNGEPINVTYPNNTIPGTKRIVVEVISRDGKIGYKTLDYEVEE